MKKRENKKSKCPYDSHSNAKLKKKTKEANASMTHVQMQNWKNCVGYKQINKVIFSMCVATMHCLNYSGQESKKKKLLEVYGSDMPMTLK